MEFVRRIDRGGFGFVDEVETPKGVRVARKSVDPQVADPTERVNLQRRFEREVRIQSAIRHPNIMPVLEASLDAEPPWFTMPLASVSLEHKIRDDHARGEFDPSPWQDIRAAVKELHRLGYLHRDLKPANTLLVGGS
jgi:serine/threonine protein kinase